MYEFYEKNSDNRDNGSSSCADQGKGVSRFFSGDFEKRDAFRGMYL